MCPRFFSSSFYSLLLTFLRTTTGLFLVSEKSFISQIVVQNPVEKMGDAQRGGVIMIIGAIFHRLP